MNRTGLLLATTLTTLLGSCAPAVMRVSDAVLEAQASTPYGPFTFRCNAARSAEQAGATIVLNGDQNAIGCTSPDGRATLVLTLFTVRTPGSHVSVNIAPSGQRAELKDVWVGGTTSGPYRQLVLLVATETGTPLTFIGTAELGSGTYAPYLTGRIGGTFKSDLSGGVTVQGSYNLTTRLERK